MTYYTGLIVVLMICLYFIIGIAITLDSWIIPTMFKNPLHKLWFVTLWPLSFCIGLVYNIYLAIKCYIEEVIDYYQEKNDESED